MIYIPTKFHKNYSGRYQSYRAGTIFIRKISKGHKAVQNVGGVSVFFSAHRLIMIYSCTKFHENILNLEYQNYGADTKS